ncbi:hypothetical protein INT47_011724 [Mucor saturninus]|uniref:Uncharacterized protein n=1 Tax=Mucor saturninus TaxID=64648 RepID=A0A8H7V1F7_9FUNG|nr:hypothetical protein INT47_011724 [Mucor saturninus]
MTVVLKQRILDDPYTYRRYRESQQLSLVEEVGKKKRFELKTDAQLKHFIDQAFCSEDPNNPMSYKITPVATKDIFETITQYTSLFDHRTPQYFAKWCSTHSVSFLKAKPDKNSSSRKRQLYVLDDSYYVCWKKYAVVCQFEKKMITKSSAVSANNTK